MSNPIVFISRNRIKEGLLDSFAQHYRDSVPRTEAGKPLTLVQVAYLNEDATQVDIVRFFPNAEAMDLQLQGADDRSKLAYQFIEPTSIDVYGMPTDASMEMIRKVAGSGIEVRVYPRFAGGFIRPTSR